MSRRHRTRAFFDRIAGTYGENRYGPGADEWRRYFFGERLSLARGLLGDPPGPVLDLGSGPGILEAALGPRVLSLDLSPAMLREAAGNAVAGDATRIPLRSGSMAAVCALGLTTYLPELDSFFSECCRVLAPDGKLVFSITRRGAPDTLARAATRAVTSALSLRGGSVLTAGLRPRAWSVAEVERKLRRRGFRLVAVRRHNFTVFPVCYLFRSTSVRLGRRLERSASPAFDRLASDAVLLARKEERPARRPRRIRVVRVIARLNVGGPARQAVLLTKHLPEETYDSTLVTGRVEPHEGDFLPLAREAGVAPRVVEGLGRTVSPFSDLKALAALLRIFLAERPHVVHTHTAKAGALGRVAALLAGVPVRIHTFHGHVLHGYFGRAGSALAREAERMLARLATRVVAVSPEVKDDLCRRHRVIPAAKVEVVPLGLELLPLAVAGGRRGELRTELGLSPEAPIVGVVGRVTAIKDPELLLETAKRVIREEPRARFVVVGGGDRLEETKRLAEEMGLADSVRFLGFRHDLERILADLSVALLTSRNEGTPVALIEAAAAGVPAVATRVGGVPTVVEDGVTGLVVPGRDPDALAAAVVSILRDPELGARMGAAARERALRRFGLKRLLQDIDRLYRVSLLRNRR